MCMYLFSSKSENYKTYILNNTNKYIVAYYPTL